MNFFSLNSTMRAILSAIVSLWSCRISIIVIGTFSVLLCLLPTAISGQAQGATKAVASVRLVLPEKPNAVIENIARVFARQVSQRCNATISKAGNSQLRVILTIESGPGVEGYKIIDDGKDGVRVVGNDERGLLYGVGKFLHSSRYDQGGFTPSDWRGTSRPEGVFCALDADTHFMNFYDAAEPRKCKHTSKTLVCGGPNW